jgi:S-adenosylmethionine decarboxylase
LEKLGRHYILELCGANQEYLNNKEYILTSLREAITIAKATLLEEIAIEFTPQGITAVCLLAESHMSIHTWPEKEYAAVDVFTCGTHTDPSLACDFLVDAFQSKLHKLQLIERGI